MKYFIYFFVGYAGIGMLFTLAGVLITQLVNKEPKKEEPYGYSIGSSISEPEYGCMIWLILFITIATGCALI